MSKPRTTTVDEPNSIQMKVLGDDRIEVVITSGKHRIVIKTGDWMLYCAAQKMHKVRHEIRRGLMSHYNSMGTAMDDTTKGES